MTADSGNDQSQMDRNNTSVVVSVRAVLSTGDDLDARYR